MIEISLDDVSQISALGISEDQLKRQVNQLKIGTAPVKLTAPATINNGITALSDGQKKHYSNYFSENISPLNVCHFVPASGAATRMFKAFFQFLKNQIDTEDIRIFARNFKAFAFYDQIKCASEDDYKCAIDKMIGELNLPELPKALIPFHIYGNTARTALEEHIIESRLIQGLSKTINIHFTISAEHQHKIDELLQEKLALLEGELSCNYEVSFSHQLAKTDTVALNAESDILRDSQGQILFRPGGHGSLLENLQALDYELVFIKNIDNIQPDHLKSTTVLHKKVLGGYLISIQKELKSLLAKVHKDGSDLKYWEEFVSSKLNIRIPGDYDSLSTKLKKKFLIKMLNRPIRVCGMVKNEGEPGGGPFWISDSNGEESLQIVESSQINMADEGQLQKFKLATHFNPVDIVCWLKDYRGNKFKLSSFTDPDTTFVSSKVIGGKECKILEHPGLWNGAMAHWITVFIEVPLSTFNPVKSVIDLLKPQHQPA